MLVVICDESELRQAERAHVRIQKRPRIRYRHQPADAQDNEIIWMVHAAKWSWQVSHCGEDV